MYIIRGSLHLNGGAMSASWTILTSHGHVLFYLASRPDATMRDIADDLGLSERRVATILRDLETSDTIHSTRVGVRKHHEINPAARFRHPTLNHLTLSAVLDDIQVRDPGERPLRWRQAAGNPRDES